MRRLLIVLSAFVSCFASVAQQMANSIEHSKYILAVDEYLPAPGQFVNALPVYKVGDTADSMAVKCTASLANGNNGLVTLGAYGGFITFHFDHSIANIQGERDIYLKGNGFNNNSEPGIVMVSKDMNGNGIADDEWFEISGSADVDSAAKMIYDYEITYTMDSLQNIPWSDNYGNTGSVDRLAFHKQEYYPLWISDTTLTFHGTLLPHNCTATAAPFLLASFAWGYVDNCSSSDTLGCSVDISWAVNPSTRKAVDLDFVDFVRVYNAENQKCGWLGETSTELCGAEDLHLEASISAIEKAIADEASNNDEVVTSVIPVSSNVLHVKKRVNLAGRVVGKGYRGVVIEILDNGEARMSICR